MTDLRKLIGINLHSRASVRHRMITDEPEVVALLGALDWGSMDRGASGPAENPSTASEGAGH